MSIKNILLTGKPRCGKTTMIIKMILHLKSDVGGFFTEDFYQGNQRMGFKITNLQGTEGILAKKGLKSRFRLRDYGINLKDLEEIGVAAIEEAVKTKQVVVIDEIGKMELFSENFRNATLKALNSKKKVLGTIQQSNLAFFKQIRARQDTAVLELKSNNREETFEKLKEVFSCG